MVSERVFRNTVPCSDRVFWSGSDRVFWGDAWGNFPCSGGPLRGRPRNTRFFPEASPQNTVGTRRRNTIGTLNQCSEPAFRDQLSTASTFLHELQRIRTPIPPPDVIYRDGAPQRGPDPKRRSQKNPTPQKLQAQFCPPPPVPGGAECLTSRSHTFSTCPKHCYLHYFWHVRGYGFSK